MSKEWSDYRYGKWCTTSDDWYPNIDGNLVKVQVMILPPHGKGDVVRTLVRGNDDCAMSRDERVADFGAAECLFRYRKKEVDKWTHVTKAELAKLGFNDD